MIETKTALTDKPRNILKNIIESKLGLNITIPQREYGAKYNWYCFTVPTDFLNDTINSIMIASNYSMKECIKGLRNRQMDLIKKDNLLMVECI